MILMPSLVGCQDASQSQAQSRQPIADEDRDQESADAESLLAAEDVEICKEGGDHAFLLGGLTVLVRDGHLDLGTESEATIVSGIVEFIPTAADPRGLHDFRYELDDEALPGKAPTLVMDTRHLSAGAHRVTFVLKNGCDREAATNKEFVVDNS